VLIKSSLRRRLVSHWDNRLRCTFNRGGQLREKGSFVKEKRSVRKSKGFNRGNIHIEQRRNLVFQEKTRRKGGKGGYINLIKGLWEAERNTPMMRNFIRR